DPNRPHQHPDEDGHHQDRDAEDGRPGPGAHPATGRVRAAHAAFASAESAASEIRRKRSTILGPQRDATSSFSGTTSPRVTAESSCQPGRRDTVSSDWPQHLVSARKIRSGSDSMMYSADS